MLGNGSAFGADVPPSPGDGAGAGAGEASGCGPPLLSFCGKEWVANASKRHVQTRIRIVEFIWILGMSGFEVAPFSYNSRKVSNVLMWLPKVDLRLAAAQCGKPWLTGSRFEES